MVAVSETRRRTEVLRVLHRYLTEIVERYDLCPWAKVAREKGEVAIEVLWGTPTVDEWVAASLRVLAQPGAKVAMIVAPELVIDPVPLHTLRGEVSTRVPGAGIAEFHPAAALDLASPARLVPFVRRSPDPLLQLVPLALLSSVRTQRVVMDVYEQAQILKGLALPPRQDAADRIADNNHATVSTAHATIIATLDDIAADRRRSYDLVGISGSR